MWTWGTIERGMSEEHVNALALGTEVLTCRRANLEEGSLSNHEGSLLAPTEVFLAPATRRRPENLLRLPRSSTPALGADDRQDI